jgi:hypothetical protein
MSVSTPRRHEADPLEGEVRRAPHGLGQVAVPRAVTRMLHLPRQGQQLAQGRQRSPQFPTHLAIWPRQYDACHVACRAAWLGGQGGFIAAVSTNRQPGQVP